jgi:hypothetical protein
MELSLCEYYPPRDHNKWVSHKRWNFRKFLRNNFQNIPPRNYNQQ